MILSFIIEACVIAFVNRYGSDATVLTALWIKLQVMSKCPAVSLVNYRFLFLQQQSIGRNQFDRLQKVCEGRYYELRHVVVLILLFIILKRHFITNFLTSQTTIENAHSLVID